MNVYFLLVDAEGGSGGSCGFVKYFVLEIWERVVTRLG